MQLFENLGLLPQLVSAVEKQGYQAPTPIQTAAIPAILAGGDLFATAPTGTGKTAAFAIPIIQQIIEKPQREIHALILAPTRELAHQISDNFRKYSAGSKLRIALVYGGVSQRKQVEDIRRGCQVLIATPGRLLDLIEQGHINLAAINTWVLDECDRMLDMGFIGDIRQIGKLMKNDHKQTLLFSATAPKEIRFLSQELLNEPTNIDIAPINAEKPKINQQLFAVSRNDKFELLNDILDQDTVDNVLVFTKTKHGADKLVKQLRDINEYAVAIHGDKSQRERTKNLDLFKEGRARVLVATDVAARGVDIPALNLVINYDMPLDSDTYTHRISRTGRAGSEGVAMSFCDQSETNLLDMLHKELDNIELNEIDHEYRIELTRRGRGGKKGGNRNSERWGQVELQKGFGRGKSKEARAPRDRSDRGGDRTEKPNRKLSSEEILKAIENDPALFKAIYGNANPSKSSSKPNNGGFERSDRNRNDRGRSNDRGPVQEHRGFGQSKNNREKDSSGSNTGGTEQRSHRGSKPGEQRGKKKSFGGGFSSGAAQRKKNPSGHKNKFKVNNY